MTTHPFELLIAKSNGDEICTVEIEAEATIYPYQPQTAPSYASGGEPAEDGKAEITALQFTDARNVTQDVSALLHILPQSFIDELETTIYENHDDGSDHAWDERQERINQGTIGRFRMLTGRAAG